MAYINLVNYIKDVIRSYVIRNGLNFGGLKHEVDLYIAAANSSNVEFLPCEITNEHILIISYKKDNTYEKKYINIGEVIKDADRL